MKTLVLALLIIFTSYLHADEMKQIEYLQHEPHYEPKKVKGDLVTFVYDVPYLSACGIFPPLHILNKILSKGGGDAGMGPGTSWEKFTLTKAEYNELWNKIESTDPVTLKNKARYIFVKYKRDPQLEEITDHLKWMRKSCEKHKEWFFNEQNKNHV